MKEWTDARKHSFIVGVLRSGTRRYPPKYQCLARAKTEKRTNPKSGRVCQFYQCNGCGNDFPAKEVQVDHIKPVVTARGFTTWDSYINRLFCDGDNFQVLCLTCHKKKSAKERAKRK